MSCELPHRVGTNTADVSQPNGWPEWMSRATAARYSDVSVRTVARWIDAGLPACRVSTGAIRVRRASLDSWLAQQEAASASH